MTNKKQESPLVAAVLALQSHLEELDRIGLKISSTDMTADIDMEYVQKLLTHFAECGQGVSEQVGHLSAHLQEARTRAEAVAGRVSQQAEAFRVRRQEVATQLERFRQLGEQVRELNSAINQSLRPESNGSADSEKADWRSNVSGLEQRLSVLIGDLQDLRNSARASGMKALEKSAESMAQTLEAVQVKLRNLG